MPPLLPVNAWESTLILGTQHEYVDSSYVQSYQCLEVFKKDKRTWGGGHKRDWCSRQKAKQLALEKE